VKFLARARRKGFREILLGTVKIPKALEKFDLTVPAEKAQSKIHDKNELVFEELVLLIDTSQGEGRVAFQSVCCSKSNDYKNGNATDAWKQLTDKYVPNMAPIKLELKSEFQKSNFQDASEDPDMWILNLESICARLKDLKADILDKDFIIHVLNGLLANYKVQVSKLEEQFGSTTNLLSIQDMQNELNLKFARLKCLAAEKTKSDQALVAFCCYKGIAENSGISRWSAGASWHQQKRKKAEFEEREGQQ